MDDETTYREMLQSFLREMVYPHVQEWERRALFPAEVVRGLGAHGFFTPCLMQHQPEGRRALPINIRMFKILIEELAKTQCFGLTLSVSMHVGVFLPMLVRLAQPAAAQELVPLALRGEVLGTIAATEANVAGSDFMSMECSAEIDETRITLDGQKHYCTNAAVADFVIVFARLKPGRHFTNFCALLVPTGLPGVRRSRLDMAVMKTAVVSRIEFDRVTLEPVALLGRKEFGMRYFLDHIPVERLSGGIWAVAAAEQCLGQTQAYAAQRMVGADSLWSRSAVRQRIAEAIVQVAMLRSLVDQAVERTAASQCVDAFDSAVIKAATAPAMESVIGLCLQLQGARGLEADSPLLRLLNDFRVFGVGGGATETMLEIIADLWSEQVAGTFKP